MDQGVLIVVKKHYRLAALVIVLVTSVLLAGCDQPAPLSVEESESVVKTTETASAFPRSTFTEDSYIPSRKNGAEIYKVRCAQCHGVTGIGDGAAAKSFKFKVPDLTSSKYQMDLTVASVADQTASGDFIASMPSFKEILTPEELADVSVYVTTLASKTADIVRGRLVYERYCMSCHGEKGDGKGKTLVVSTEKADLVDTSRSAFRSRADNFKITMNGYTAGSMPAFKGVIASEDIAPLLDHLLLLTYKP